MADGDAEADFDGGDDAEAMDIVNRRLAEVDLEELAATVDMLRRDETAMKRLLHSLHVDLEVCTAGKGWNVYARMRGCVCAMSLRCCQTFAWRV